MPSVKSSKRKATDAWPPRWLTPPPPGPTRGPQVRDFIAKFCRSTKETIAGPAGQKLRLRPWQERLIDALYAERPDGVLRYRQGLIGMPRKNGKTALGASIALHGLYLGPDGGEVYSVAGDRDQARICFGMARRMVQLDPELSDPKVTRIFRDAIEFMDTGSVYRVLSSDAPLKEGLSPTLVLFDEVHVQPDDSLWSVMNLGSGARREALVLGITTAGARINSLGQPSLCYRLYEYGQAVARGEIDDDRFFFAWWEPAAGFDADWRSPETWREANPGYDDIVSADDFEANLPPKVPEHEFRTKRTNLWVDAAESGWLADHPGCWEACAADLDIPDGAEVCLGVDVALRHDSTAVAIATKIADRVVVRARVWNPAERRVDHTEIMQHIRDLARQYQVISVAYDPRFFEVPAQMLLDEGIPMVEVPQGPQRMVPICGHLYDLIVNGKLAHDSDPVVSMHVLSAVRRDGEYGWTLSKGKSRRHIDACIAIALACWELEQAQAPGQPFALWA